MSFDAVLKALEAKDEGDNRKLVHAILDDICINLIVDGKKVKSYLLLNGKYGVMLMKHVNAVFLEAVAEPTDKKKS
jgi:hypothetical protein